MDFNKLFSLEGKVALVTGAAYGIGFAIAEAYAKAGAKIAFNCRSQHHMDQALADYKAKGIDAKGYICDVTDEEQVKNMVADIEKELGIIDILVNNAGIIKRIPMTEMSVDDFKQVIDIESLNTVFASIVNVVLSSVIAIFSITFITFFFLRDEGLFYAMITAMFPERYHENITRALDSVTLLLARYFTGILSESLLLMVAVSLTMMAFGMKAADAAFIGLVMGVMNVVPYAGPLIGGVVSVFVGIVTPIGGMTVGHTAAVIIGSLLILKGLDDFVLQPTLYSSRVKAHPLEIFLVILIAGSLAGILGMLLAIPSYTVLRVFAKEFFSQFSLVRKLTEKI